MTEAAHILVVDDEADIRDELQEYLVRKGFRVSTADGGPAMRRILDRKPADLIILDLTMPKEHGLTLVGDLRKTSNAGIIILTGTGEAADEIVGLELGADDYMSKPCNLRELLARVRSVLRRVAGGNDAAIQGDEASLQFVGWSFNLSARRLISPENSEVLLTTAEFDLLATFVNNASRVLNRDQLLDITHDREWSPFDRSVDNLVSRLRRKIEADPKKPTLIKTVRGTGYVFTPKVTRD
ncbi:MAG: response regulator [Alphaproteobacteria bacterium]|nr:response regulator [Alphaproteobacteria bacterium]